MLIQNLAANGLITSERVKRAMLGVCVTFFLLSSFSRAEIICCFSMILQPVQPGNHSFAHAQLYREGGRTGTRGVYDGSGNRSSETVRYISYRNQDLSLSSYTMRLPSRQPSLYS